MERKKLFSSELERRKLFSTSRRRLFSEDQNIVSEVNPIPGGKIVICQDCGNQIEIAGITTDVNCPVCGGKRFNFLQTMTAPSGCESPGAGDGVAKNEVDKVFSNIRNGRRKLFSSLTRLYPNKDGEGTSNEQGLLHPFRCPDCGLLFEDESETPSGVTCSISGGSRCQKVE